MRTAAIAYGLFAYLCFLASFLAVICAAAGPFGPFPSIDAAPAWPAGLALALDLGLLLAFGLQHSIMARRSFKRWARLPARLERSTFVLASSACVGAIALYWKPIGGELWAARGVGASLLRGISLAGFALTTLASFAFDHFELFGVRQVLQPATALDRALFREPLPYRYVRHPMQLGILIGIWAAPRMTAGHAVFAAGLTLYILIGISFEERDLLRDFGQHYADYRARVPMLLPRLRKLAVTVAQAPGHALVGAGGHSPVEDLEGSAK